MLSESMPDIISTVSWRLTVVDAGRGNENQARQPPSGSRYLGERTALAAAADCRGRDHSRQRATDRLSEQREMSSVQIALESPFLVVLH